MREQEDPSTALDIRGCEWNIDLHPASVKGIEELIVTVLVAMHYPSSATGYLSPM